MSIVCFSEESHDWIADGVMGTAPLKKCTKCGHVEFDIRFCEEDFERMAGMERNPRPPTPVMIEATKLYFQLLEAKNRRDDK